LLQEICHLIIEKGSYRMAWVGFAENDPQKTVRVAACAGYAEGFLENARITWSDADERGRGPTGISIRTGETVVCNDYLNDERMTPWWADASKRGYRASITIPLKNDGRNFGVLVIYASVCKAFNPNEVALLTELADDLAYGIHSLRTRQDHLRAETARRESEQLSQQTIDALVSHICVLDEGGTILTTNQAWRQFAELSSALKSQKDESVNYLKICDGTTGREAADAARMAQGIRAVLRGELAVFEMEYPCPGKDKDQWFSARVTRFGGEKMVRAVVAHENITERRRAAARVKESEQRYRSLIAQLPQRIFLKNKDSVYLSCNAKYALDLGIKPEQIEGKDDFAFYSRTLAEKYQADDQSVMAGGIVKEFEEHLVSNGQEVWIHTLKAPYYDVSGQVVGVLGIFEEITSRKQAEESLRASEARFRGIIEASPVPFALNNERQEITYLNAAFVNTFGYDLADIPTLAEWWLKAYPDPVYRQWVATTWDETRSRAIQTNQPFVPMEVKIQCKDGMQRNVLVTATSLGETLSETHLVVLYDITERIRHEEALRQSRELLDATGQMAKVGGWEWNLDKQILTWTREVYRIHGVTEEFQPTVASGINFYTPESRSAIAGAVQRASEQGEGFDLTLQIITAQGETRWVHTVGEANRKAGRISSVFGSFQDVTVQKRESESLKLFRTLVDHSNDAFEVLDPETGRYLDVNLRGCLDLGYTREEYLALSVFDVDPDVDQAAFHKTMVELRAKGSLLWLGRHRRKDGSTFPVEVSVKYVQLERDYLVAEIRDITERKKATESLARLAMAVEHAAETIVITDLQGIIVYANPAFERTTGYTRAEAIGQNPRILKSGKQDAAYYRQMWEMVKRGEMWHGFFVNRRKDGSHYQEEATITPILDETGHIINFLAVKRDVTHEVALESQLRQSQKMEAVGHLAGGIAHDFNNILTVLFGYSNLLQLDLAGNPPALEKLEEILKAGERAKDLVQQILTFSRQRELERQIIRLESIIKEATKFLRSSLPSNLQVQVDLAADVPAVFADATQIYQVVVNLGTNALHAMEGQTGQLVVRLDAFQPDAALLQVQPKLRAIPYARLTVADTGHGMDAETQERIFEPFFTTKPIGKGTGLGLSVVHGIVQSHEGVITVESQPGQGTTFRLYFPAVKMAGSLAGQLESKTPRGKGQNILVVDDEAALLVMYLKLLKVLNYEGTVTSSAREAIDWVRENPARFDLVLTDLTMPEMNGLEVARQIHTLRPDLPIILATGFSGTLTRKQLHAVGVCQLVEKPVSMASLANALRDLLGES